MVNSLAQFLLKLASPGVPDFYQGSELWDLSLVDRDNRRPVDYARHRALLAALMPTITRLEAGETTEHGLADVFRTMPVALLLAEPGVTADRASSSPP